MKKFLFVAVFLMCMGMINTASAVEPMESLKESMEKILKLLADPQYKEIDTENPQRQKITIITNGLFDYTEMAKRALARNWRIFTPAQRQEFRDVFAELLENIYYKKVYGEYTNETVIYQKQHKISDGKARVETFIHRETVDIPVKYSMKSSKGVWRVYDVNIEGVSLIKNYRSQFAKILSKNKPEYLIQRLRDKVAQLEKKENSEQ
ncbi:MAG: ABC transporter substrate-binding protein [Deltaproteobacteria bacterium]|nr:ABC transporter substrate-binding protein [Deltaproteobacteria bacterium]